MKVYFRVLIVSILVISLFAAGCGGGGGGGSSSVAPAGESLSGSVVLPADAAETITKNIVANVSYEGMKVYLFDINDNDIVSPVELGSTGAFSFPDIPAGSNYQLVVITPAGKRLLRKHIDAFSEARASVNINSESTALAILVKQSNFEKSETSLSEVISPAVISSLAEKITEWLKGSSPSTENDVFAVIIAEVGAIEIQKIIDGVSSAGEVSVMGVMFDKTDILMVLGQTQTLVPVFAPNNASNKNVTWSSSNKSVATVVDGLVTCVGNGHTVISATAEAGDYTATCNITVDYTDEIYFTFDSATKTISNYHSAGGSIVAIPPTIGGIAVEHIGYGAFREKSITKVTIPTGVVTIDDWAFYTNQITNVIIPVSVVSIGVAAFNTNQITAIAFPTNVTNIGAGSFYNNKLTCLTIPANVTVIGSNAFQNNQLTTVKIENGIIGENAFRENQITSLTLGHGVSKINLNAFYENQITNLIIPDSVTSIGWAAFQGNKLTTLAIGNGVNSIGEDAFRNNLLTSVTIGNGVATIERNAFQDNLPAVCFCTAYENNEKRAGRYIATAGGGWVVP